LELNRVEKKRERVDKKEIVLLMGRKRKTRQGEEKQRRKGSGVLPRTCA
jgi:hypothetical protein